MCDLLGRTGRIDQLHPIRLLGGDDVEGCHDLAVVFVRAAADAIAPVGVARTRSFASLVEREDERAVRKVLADAESVDRPHCLYTEAASAALISERAVDETVGQYPFPIFDCGTDRLGDVIGARGRRLDFQKLSDDAMTSILETQAPGLSAAERQRIISMSFGSAGRALAFAELDLAKLEEAALAILRQGDPTNARRSDLASELGKKGAADRYAAFLDLAPSLIAREARQLDGAPRERALDAYAKARELAAIAPRVSLDPAATVFQLGGILSSVQAA